MKNKEIIDFCKRESISEEQFYGKEKIEGSLDLNSLTSIPDSFNPTVEGFLDLGSLTSIPEGFNPTVGNFLNLDSLISIPKGFNPNVGGSLYLESVMSIPDGFNPTVGVCLYLSSLTSIPKGFNPIVEGSLYLNSITSIPDGFDPIVGGSLELGSLTSIPEGFNPTVGGNLDLSSVTSVPTGFNPTVGRDLFLSSLKSIPKGFNPIVGRDLFLSSLTSIPEGFTPTIGGCLDLSSKLEYINNLPKDYIFSWQNGKYIKVDGIFCELLYKRKNVFTCKRINNDKRFFIVTDNEGNYSHGDTIKEAKEDLIFKISNRDKSDYEGLGLDDVLTYAEAIECYRVITGACSFGTKDFCNNRLKNKKEKYSIREIIEVTANEYKNESFKQFFAK